MMAREDAVVAGHVKAWRRDQGAQTRHELLDVHVDVGNAETRGLLEEDAHRAVRERLDGIVGEGLAQQVAAQASSSMGPTASSTCASTAVMRSKVGAEAAKSNTGIGWPRPPRERVARRFEILAPILVVPHRSPPPRVRGSHRMASWLRSVAQSTHSFRYDLWSGFWQNHWSGLRDLF
jgi:hypothetical protein